MGTKFYQQINLLNISDKFQKIIKKAKKYSMAKSDLNKLSANKVFEKIEEKINLE